MAGIPAANWAVFAINVSRDRFTPEQHCKVALAAACAPPVAPASVPLSVPTCKQSAAKPPRSPRPIDARRTGRESALRCIRRACGGAPGRQRRIEVLVGLLASVARARRDAEIACAGIECAREQPVRLAKRLCIPRPTPTERSARSYPGPHDLLQPAQ